MIKRQWKIHRRKMSRNNETEKQGLREEQEEKGAFLRGSLSPVLTSGPMCPLPDCRLQINMTVTCCLKTCPVIIDKWRALVSWGLHRFLLQSSNSVSRNRTSGSTYIGHAVLTPTLEIKEVYYSNTWQFLIPDNSILFFSTSSFLHMDNDIRCTYFPVGRRVIFISSFSCNEGSNNESFWLKVINGFIKVYARTDVIRSLQRVCAIEVSDTVLVWYDLIDYQPS
jgi:hypothetical protein